MPLTGHPAPRIKRRSRRRQRLDVEGLLGGQSQGPRLRTIRSHMAEIGVPIFDDLVVFVGKDPMFDRHFGTITLHESPAVAAMLDEKTELEQGDLRRLACELYREEPLEFRCLDFLLIRPGQCLRHRCSVIKVLLKIEFLIKSSQEQTSGPAARANYRVTRSIPVKAEGRGCYSKMIMLGVNGNVFMSVCGDDKPDDERKKRLEIIQRVFRGELTMVEAGMKMWISITVL